MQIYYIDPLSKAWRRMKKALFEPFDIRKWFVMGFTFFLAGLLSGAPVGNYQFGRGKTRLPEIEHLPERALDWLRAHPIWLIVIFAAIVLSIIIVLVLTWLSSRGAFMFLDNVVHDRALVVEPWYKLGGLGNSFFLWRIGFGIVCFLIMIPLLILGFLVLLPLVHGRAAIDSIFELLGVAALWLLVIVIIAYISLFTKNFVVPLMYKHQVRVLQAWRMFIPILASHLVYFLVYGLFLLLLAIGVGIAIVFAGCLTCCVGFLLLALPYIGSVILLPIGFIYRDFSLEFLAQWGPEYSVFPNPE
jgi:hypothetical protein